MMDAESVRNMQSDLAVTNKQYCQRCILSVVYIIYFNSYFGKKQTEVLWNRKLRIILVSKRTTISGGGRNFYKEWFQYFESSRKDQVGGHVTEDRNVSSILVEKCEGKRNFEGQCITVRVILKFILNNRLLGVLEWIYTTENRPLAGCSELCIYALEIIT